MPAFQMTNVLEHCTELEQNVALARALNLYSTRPGMEPKQNYQTNKNMVTIMYLK